ncbi:MAG TPA: peptidylprolyl isomerase [Candidatus Cloacimonadota bacterium]|nr:peptidylprolyl isomerase [Candidatus Cloacimonadota bacterium]
MKYVVSFLVVLMSVSLFCQTVAQVGNYAISQQELSDEMNNFADRDDITYKQARQMALDNLINKYVLISYADENGIKVDAVELEAFFQKELGDLPRFQTDGQFSVAKYRTFLETPTGMKIKSEMESEILVNKTRTLIENNFNISDENLLRQFLLEKTEIDLGYAIIDVEDANITEPVSFAEAKHRFNKVRSQYESTDKVKLQFFIVFKADFWEEAKPLVQQKVAEVCATDSTLSPEDIAVLEKQFTTEETGKLAEEKALSLLECQRSGKETDYPLLETNYLEQNEIMGNLPAAIIGQAFDLPERVFNAPIDIGDAVLVFQVVDHKKFRKADQTVAAHTFWRDYTEEMKKHFTDYREYFDNHIDQFASDVAVVNIVEINNPPRFSSIPKAEFVENIRKDLQQNIDDQMQIRKILQDNGLKIEPKILYLENFENDNVRENVIVRMINKNSSFGFLPISDGLLFFQVLSFFPNYLPRYEDIREQLPNIIVLSHTDTTEFRAYYDDHLKDFYSPDSLKLGGVLFDIAAFADTLDFSVSDEELQDIYTNHLDSYYRKRSVKFDYIYVNNPEKANLIQNYLKSGISFQTLKFCFNEPYQLANSETVQYDDLPRVIRESLLRMLNGSIYQPVEYDGGWFILNKIKEFPDGIIPFSEIKPEIEKKLRLEEAKNAAYLAAKTIFDSTSYFSHLYKYFQDDQIFETPYQNADDDFAVLGSIKDYKRDLMRIWKNEKFSSIIRTKDGYAVVFVLQKHSASQQSFAQSLDDIESIFRAKNRFDNAKNFVNTIRDSIVAGADADQMLHFLGGWKRARNLSLTSRIPGVDFSRDIMSDILIRSEGYCSPVIPVNVNQLFFYFVERLEKPASTDFYEQKADYKNKYIEDGYNNWLNQYRVKLNIIVNE